MFNIRPTPTFVILGFGLTINYLKLTQYKGKSTLNLHKIELCHVYIYIVYIIQCKANPYTRHPKPKAINMYKYICIL